MPSHQLERVAGPQPYALRNTRNRWPAETLKGVVHLTRTEQRPSRIVGELHPATRCDHRERCHFWILERSPQTLALERRVAKLAELAPSEMRARSTMTTVLSKTRILPDGRSGGDLRPFKHVGAEFTDHYLEFGFALLANALAPDELAAVNTDALKLCRGDFGTIQYGSSGVEGESEKPADLTCPGTDDEMLRRYLCIHFPHKVSPAARMALMNPRIVEGLTAVIGPNVKAMQSMLFIKSEGKPGQAWHQDEYFIPTRDRSLTAVWIALDDATIENGCLWVLPGSHRRGVLYPTHPQTDPRFDCTVEAYEFPYRDDEAVPVEIPAGTALIFNGYLLHRSLENSGSAWLPARACQPLHERGIPVAMAPAA